MHGRGRNRIAKPGSNTGAKSSPSPAEDPNQLSHALILDDESADRYSLAPREVVLKRIAASGRISTVDLSSILEDIRRVSLFSEASKTQIMWALQFGTIRRGLQEEVIWEPKQREESSGARIHRAILSFDNDPIFIIVLVGCVIVSRSNGSEPDEQIAGYMAATDDPEVQSITSLPNTTCLAVDLAVCRFALAAAEKVSSQLFKHFPVRPALLDWPESGRSMLAEFLQHQAFFEDHSWQALLQLVPCLRWRSFADGEKLCAEASEEDGNSCAFLVLRGKLQALKEEATTTLGAANTTQPSRANSNDRPTSKDRASAQGMFGANRGSILLARLQGPSANNEGKEQTTNDQVRSFKRCAVHEAGSVACLETLMNLPDLVGAAPYTIQALGDAEVLELSRASYEKALGSSVVDRQRTAFILQSVPPSRPGLPSDRTRSQLELLRRLIEKAAEFKDLPKATLTNMAASATYFAAAQDQIVFLQGMPGDSFYSLIEGRVTIHVKSEKRRSSSARQLQRAVGAAKLSMRLLSSRRRSSLGKGELSPEKRQPCTESLTSNRMSPAGISEEQSPVKMGSTSRRRSSTALPRAVDEASRRSSLNSRRSSLARAEEFPTEENECEEGEEEKDADEEKVSAAVPRHRESCLVPKFAGPAWLEPSEILMRSARLSQRRRDLGPVVNALTNEAGFGAKTLLFQEPRTASVRTTEVSKFLVVSRDSYIALMQSKDQAQLHERMEFLTKVLVSADTAQMRSSLVQAIEKLASEMQRVTMTRGHVLVAQGEITRQSIWILRSGVVAMRSRGPGGTVLTPRALNLRQKPRAAMASSTLLLVSGVGELFGTSSSVLGHPEPLTIAAESASCEAYVLSWAQMQKLMPKFVLERIRAVSLSNHERYSCMKPLGVEEAKSFWQGNAAAATQEAKQTAWESFFDSAANFKDGLSFGQRGRRVAPLDVDAVLSDLMSRLEAQIAPRLEEQIAPRISRPPPDSSSERLRARIVMEFDRHASSAGHARHRLTAALEDQSKGDVVQWAKTHLLCPALRENSELHSVRLMARKFFKESSRASA